MEDQEVYQITFKGLIISALKDESQTNQLLDRIELYLRRHYSKDGSPAIIYDLQKNEWVFGTVKSE